jgi:hypothetical protein
MASSIPYAFMVYDQTHYRVYLKLTDYGTYDVLYAKYDPTQHVSEIDAIKEAGGAKMDWMLQVQYQIQQVRLIVAPSHAVTGLSDFAFDYFGQPLNKTEMLGRLSDTASALLSSLQGVGTCVGNQPCY